MRNEALFTSDSAEHNTPPEIAAAARDVFGGEIGLDPASNAAAQKYIRASVHWTIEDDRLTPTLTRRWRASSVWLNPPFTQPSGRKNAAGKEIRERVIADWVAKWLETFEERDAEQGLLLVPARTDTEWFQGLWGLPMCYTAGRLRFSEAKAGAPFPTVIVYAGPLRVRFYDRFSEFGAVGKFVNN